MARSTKEEPETFLGRDSKVSETPWVFEQLPSIFMEPDGHGWEILTVSYARPRNVGDFFDCRFINAEARVGENRAG